MRFNTVAQWLTWQETLNPREIELGLERVGCVWQQLSPGALPFTVITVAGTNGKGSCVAMLSAILTAAGYRTGAYLSPHLLQYNERIRINERDIEDANLCLAFQRVDEARGDTPLTYFEFGTLAALSVFVEAQLDVVILETGLGGRLDAVNIVDADVALITTIGIDHTDWLGNDRDSIAVEKAGIMRAGRAVVCGDVSPPVAILAQAEKLCSPLDMPGRDFSYEQAADRWAWSGREQQYHDLPLPSLIGDQQLQNAACVLDVLERLQARLPCSVEHISAGLTRIRLPGRFQTIPADLVQARSANGQATLIVDVAHNEQSAVVLAQCLNADPVPGNTIAVFGILADKDIAAVARAMKPSIDRWYIAPAVAARAASVDEMVAALQSAAITDVRCSESISQALQSAMQQASEDDRIVVFGSFYTVAEIVSHHANSSV